MASFPSENQVFSRFDAIGSRSIEDEERLERFLRMVSRSQANINRSMSILEGLRGAFDRDF